MARNCFTDVCEMFEAQIDLPRDMQDNKSNAPSEAFSLISLGEKRYSELHSLVNKSLDEGEGGEATTENVGEEGFSATQCRSDISGRPKHMKKVSQVRFASVEKLLVEFRSIDPVLKMIVEENGSDVRA